MAKPPPNLPDPGDRVRLRGRPGSTGTLVALRSNNWATLDWDAGVHEAEICHLYELEKVT